MKNQLPGAYYLHRETKELIFKADERQLRYDQIREGRDTLIERIWLARDVARSPGDFLMFLIEAAKHGASGKDIVELVGRHNLEEFMPNWKEALADEETKGEAV